MQESPKYEDIVKDLRNCFGTDSMFCDCDSCKYNGLIDDHDYSKCVETLGVDAADALEELATKLATNCNNDCKWIPVSEQLPPLEEDVLVFAYGNMIRVWMLERQYPYSADVYWECEDGYWEDVSAVTHWMPLPNKPKDGET